MSQKGASFLLLLIGILYPVTSSFAQSSNSSASTISVSVLPIIEFGILGGPVSLVIPGGRESVLTVTDQSTWYNATTNLDEITLAAKIDKPMPEGITLLLSASSTLGNANLKTEISDAVEYQDLVSGIKRGLENNQALNYTISYDAGISELEIGFRTITLAMYDESTGQISYASQKVIFGIE